MSALCRPSVVVPPRTDPGSAVRAREDVRVVIAGFSLLTDSDESVEEITSRSRTYRAGDDVGCRRAAPRENPYACSRLRLLGRGEVRGVRDQLGDVGSAANLEDV